MLMRGLDDTLNRSSRPAINPPFILATGDGVGRDVINRASWIAKQRVCCRQRTQTKRIAQHVTETRIFNQTKRNKRMSHGMRVL